MEQLGLQIFKDEQNHEIRTVNIDSEVWFYAKDICDALAIANARDAIANLDSEDIRTVGSTDSSIPPSRTNPRIINESGMYNLIFQSRKEEAKKFKRWVTKEVLPKIRKTGGYGLAGGHSFVRRFNANWDRVDRGYFSVIGELYIRLYGQLEMAGYILPDISSSGKKIRPDVSVGVAFSKWLRKTHPEKSKLRKMYSHILPDGMEINACQYPNSILSEFIEFVNNEWMVNTAPSYLKDRDPKALEYLPKILSRLTKEKIK